VKEAVEGEISDKVPATYLQEHANSVVILDQAASAELKRVKTPWLLGTIKWDEQLIRKAVIWLSKKLERPILKLTNRDYMDNGMGDIVTEFDSAYNINLTVFESLKRTITGWPGGKPNSDSTTYPERPQPTKKRSVLFSPHPDDDVISMGGTFIRLSDQGHEVHVAYQTSGNIAVFDDDVIRFADFVNDFHEEFGMKQEVTRIMFNSIKEKIASKEPGKIDSPEVQKIKTLIRKAEAKAGARYVGLPEERMHFLDMPFYQTGLVKKKPLSQADVDIIVALLQEIKPHQIFAAGDLSDPHGTHRVCLDAIFRAIQLLENEN
jgi:glucosamine-6-phosphate deaminase